MCLYPTNKTPLIAIVPIRVWKRLLTLKTDNNIRYITPYQYMEVKVGESLKGLNPNAEVQEEFPFDPYIDK